MIRRLTVLAAACALTAGGLAAAPAAIADIPRDPAAWIMARGETVDWQPGTDIWARSATVVFDGALADRPGNRHTAEVVAYQESSFRPPVVAVMVNLSLRSESCPAGGGACATVWAGTAAVPPMPGILRPAADGSVRLRTDVPASAVTTTEPEGAPVPFGDTELDVTLTPSGWRDPAGTDTATAPHVDRSASTEGYDTVSVSAGYDGTGVAATGTVAGVPAQRVTGEGRWSDRGGASGSTGRTLPPVRTLAESEPYLPTVRRDRTNRLSYGAAFWDGYVAGRGPLRTSTGWRVPGNTWRAQLYSQILLQPGDRVAGTRADGANLGLEGRNCAAGQAWDDCAPAAQGVAWQPGQVRYRIRFGGAIDIVFTAPVREQLPSGAVRDRGTLDVRATLRPDGSPGVGTRSGWLVRSENQRTWQYTATLRRTAVGSMTVGGRQVAGQDLAGARYVEYATLGEGVP